MVTSSYVERELKFDVDSGFALPELKGFLPVGGREERSAERLRSDYFDTVDGSLLQARMTLRHRDGTGDTGWQLKVPHAPFREEIHAAADGEGVPEGLARLLVGVARGQQLTQIASIVTERSVTRLQDRNGRNLAEIDDDAVHATASGDSAIATRWREVEVELGHGDVELLYALGDRLRDAGARRSKSGSKLVRALGDFPEGTESRPTTGALRAGGVVADYIVEQQRVILAGDLALRRGDDSVIHKTRVATRRLRSTLRVFKKLFDPTQAAELDQELRWWAGVLGEVRDRQVMRMRLEAMVIDLDDALLLGPVRVRIETELSRELIKHWKRLQDQIIGKRYLRLLDRIASWVQQPPWTVEAERSAKRLRPMVDRAERKVARRLRDANASADVELLHGARKAAKRARYAAEAAAPVIGNKAAAEHAKRYGKLQDLLGEHQDSLVSAALLRRLGATAGTVKGENGFAFGILHEREDRNARDARDAARRMARKYG